MAGGVEDDISRECDNSSTLAPDRPVPHVVRFRQFTSCLQPRESCSVSNVTRSPGYYGMCPEYCTSVDITSEYLKSEIRLTERQQRRTSGSAAARSDRGNGSFRHTVVGGACSPEACCDTGCWDSSPGPCLSSSSGRVSWCQPGPDSSPVCSTQDSGTDELVSAASAMLQLSRQTPISFLPTAHRCESPTDAHRPIDSALLLMHSPPPLPFSIGRPVGQDGVELLLDSEFTLSGGCEEVTMCDGASAPSSMHGPVEDVQGGEAGDTAYVPLQQAGDTAYVPLQQAGDTAYVPLQQAGDTAYVPLQQAGDTAYVPLQQAGDTAYVPLQQAGDTAYVPLQQAGDTAYVPLQQAGDTAYVPLQQAGDTNYTPLRQAGDTNYTPLRQAGDTNYTPLRQAGDTNYTPLRQAMLATDYWDDYTTCTGTVHPVQSSGAAVVPTGLDDVKVWFQMDAATVVAETSETVYSNFLQAQCIRADEVESIPLNGSEVDTTAKQDASTGPRTPGRKMSSTVHRLSSGELVGAIKGLSNDASAEYNASHSTGLYESTRKVIPVKNSDYFSTSFQTTASNLSHETDLPNISGSDMSDVNAGLISHKNEEVIDDENSPTSFDALFKYVVDSEILNSVSEVPGHNLKPSISGSEVEASSAVSPDLALPGMHPDNVVTAPASCSAGSRRVPPAASSTSGVAVRLKLGVREMGAELLSRTGKGRLWRQQGVSPGPGRHCSSLDACFLTDTDDGKLRCKLCHKPFTLKSSVRRHHRMVHHRERRYECAYCHATYFLLSDLKRHLIASHTDLKPFSCTRCRQTFSRAGELRKHACDLRAERRVRRRRVAVVIDQ